MGEKSHVLRRELHLLGRVGFVREVRTGESNAAAGRIRVSKNLLRP